MMQSLISKILVLTLLLARVSESADCNFQLLGTFDYKQPYTSSVSGASCVCLGPVEPVPVPPPCSTWTHAYDAPNDGLGNKCVTGERSKYEVYGTSLLEEAGKICYIVNSNMPLEGVYESGLRNYIRHGAVLFNFDNLVSLHAARGKPGLWGAHFSVDTDGSIKIPGLYRNVQTESVHHLNDGYATYTMYDGSASACEADEDSRYGDLTFQYFAYFNNGTKIPKALAEPQTSIKSGIRVTGNASEPTLPQFRFIHFDSDPSNDPRQLALVNAVPATPLCNIYHCLSADSLNWAAVKPATFTGQFNAGFCVDRDAFAEFDVENAEFVTSYMHECANDITAMRNTLAC